MSTLLQTLLARMADHLSLDWVVEPLEIAVAGLAADPKMRTAVSGDRVVEVTIAACSPTLGRLQRVFTTDGESPFEIAAPIMRYGGPLDEDPTQLGRMPTENETAEQWIRSAGVALMLRAHYGKPELSRAHFLAIGGQLDLTSVTANGVGVEMIHVWPDEVGREIEAGAA